MLTVLTVTDTEIEAVTYFENGVIHRTDTWLTKADGITGLMAPAPAPAPVPVPYYAYELDLKEDVYYISEIIGQSGTTILTSNIRLARYPKCHTIFYDERDYSEPPVAP